MQGIQGENGSAPSGAPDAPEGLASVLTLTGVFALGVLDFADRSALVTLMPRIRARFPADSAQAGTLAGWFLLGLALIGPIAGFAGDRFRRGRLLALGMGIWGLGTLACGFAHDVSQLRLARLFNGAGAATYLVIAPTLLADLFGRAGRSRVMSWFALSAPIGGALGIAGARLGGNPLFFVLGAAGLAVSLGVLWLPEPIRGQSEGVDPARLRLHERVGPSQADYVDMMVNSSVNYSIFGMTFATFALGGLAYWLPTFLMGAKGFSQAAATTPLAVVTFAAAALGIGLGGWGFDRGVKTHPRALFVVPGLAMLAAVPFLLVAIASAKPVLILGALFAAEALMFVHVGPCLAILANVVSPNMRGVAFAAALLTTHALGDFWSPGLMGWVSETFGREDSMMTIFGRMFAAVGAVPTLRPGQSPENLTAGMLVVVPAVVLSGLMLLSGARHLPRETALMLATLRANPRAAARSAPR